MRKELVEYAVWWVQQVFPPRARQGIVSRAVAVMDGANEGLTLLEVAQRCTPLEFSSFFNLPPIQELFLEELLTCEEGHDILLLQTK